MRLPCKIDRILHDAFSCVKLYCAPAPTLTPHSLAITSDLLLAPAAETTWINSFEEKYYASHESRVSAHAPSRLLELRNIYVTGSESIIFSDPDNVLRLCASLDQHPIRKVRRPLRSFALRIDEPVFLLGGRAPGNRGHFLVEHLPRLLLAHQNMGKDFPRKVLVTPGHGSWQSDYLRQFGFSELDVIEASPGTTWCRLAWTVPNLSRTGIAELCPPELYHELVKRLSHNKRQPSTQRTALFITRKDAPGRRLANEDQIFAIAQQFIPGIQRVSLAGLSVTQQVELFTGASTIIGPHSQAFRCALYARDALIIQLVPGFRTYDNEYRFWADNYSLLGTLHNNRSISLYANAPHSGADDTSYPTECFAAELPDLLARANLPAES